MKAKIIMLKNVLRFFGMGLGIVIIAIGLISGIQYLRFRYSPEYKAYKQAEQILKDYENDPYGGDTPEETLKLFIDALKKGDTDLAAKYFVMEKWEEWKEKLNIAKENNHLGLYIDEVSKASYGKETSPNSYLYTVVGKNGVAEFGISMSLTEKSKKWKLESL